MRTVAITRTDGGLSVLRVLDDKAKLDLEVKKCGVDVASYRVVNEGAIPLDRTFRNAWTDTGTSIAVDMDKAKVFHMERIRAVRAPVLAGLDIEWMKAMGQKHHKAADAVEAKRQALRDLPTTLDLSKAKTPEKLNAIWPKELPR